MKNNYRNAMCCYWCRYYVADKYTISGDCTNKKAWDVNKIVTTHGCGVCDLWEGEE